MLDRIEGRCRFFARFPKAGRGRAELRRELHSFVIGRYVVFYRLALMVTDIGLPGMNGHEFAAAVPASE